MRTLRKYREKYKPAGFLEANLKAEAGLCVQNIPGCKGITDHAVRYNLSSGVATFRVDLNKFRSKYIEGYVISVIDEAAEQHPITSHSSGIILTPSFILWLKRGYRGHYHIYCRYCGRHNLYSTEANEAFHKKFITHSASCSRAHTRYFTVQQLLWNLLVLGRRGEWWGGVSVNHIPKIMREGARCTAWDMEIL